jgi:predicted nucleic acid-binding protein
VPYVLDASIAACWYFRDEADIRADKSRDLLETDYAVVPLHWWFEVRNMTLLGERRMRMSEEDTSIFFERLAHLPIDIADFPNDAAVFSLARHYRLTFYDAVYLELALREKMPLATLDNALVAAARAENVPLIE